MTARYVQWPVLVFTFSIPWQNAVVYSQFGTISSVLGLLMFGAVTLEVVRRGRIRTPSALLAAFAVLVWWQGATYFWSIDAAFTVTRVSTFAQLLAMMWVIHEVCRDTRTRDRLFVAYVLGCFVVMAATLQAFRSGRIAALDPWEYRTVAEGFNPNGVAIVLALGVPMAWRTFRSSTSLPLRALSLAYFPLMLSALLLTASRTGMIAAVVALSVIPLTLFRRRQLVRAAGYGIVGIVGVAVLATAVAPRVMESGLQRNLTRLGTIFTQVARGDLGERGAIWREGGRIFADRPLVGYGSGGFRIEMERRTGTRIAAHNAFLTIWVESGAIGGVMFILILTIVASGISRLPRDERVMHGVLFATILLVLIPSNAESHKAVWLILSLLVVRPTAAQVHAAEMHRGHRELHA